MESSIQLFKFHQIGVKTTFLNGISQEKRVYVDPSARFIELLNLVLFLSQDMTNTLEGIHG